MPEETRTNLGALCVLVFPTPTPAFPTLAAEQPGAGRRPGSRSVLEAQGCY